MNRFYPAASTANIEFQIPKHALHIDIFIIIYICMYTRIFEIVLYMNNYTYWCLQSLDSLKHDFILCNPLPAGLKTQYTVDERKGRWQIPMKMKEIEQRKILVMKLALGKQKNESCLMRCVLTGCVHSCCLLMLFCWGALVLELNSRWSEKTRYRLAKDVVGTAIVLNPYDLYDRVVPITRWW